MEELMIKYDHDEGHVVEATVGYGLGETVYIPAYLIEEVLTSNQSLRKFLDKYTDWVFSKEDEDLEKYGFYKEEGQPQTEGFQYVSSGYFSEGPFTWDEITREWFEKDEVNEKWMTELFFEFGDMSDFRNVMKSLF